MPWWNKRTRDRSAQTVAQGCLNRRTLPIDTMLVPNLPLVIPIRLLLQEEVPVLSKSKSNSHMEDPLSCKYLEDTSFIESHVWTTSILLVDEVLDRLVSVT